MKCRETSMALFLVFLLMLNLSVEGKIVDKVKMKNLRKQLVKLKDKLEIERDRNSELSRDIKNCKFGKRILKNPDLDSSIS